MIVAALERATKRFAETTGVFDVSLELRAGEILALLGPNGAGKSTTLSLLLGLRRPDSGTVRLLDRDPGELASKARVGVSPQDHAFPQALRVSEIVELVRAHYPRPVETSELLGRFGLENVARRQAGGLSGGERRRLATALAFCGNPDVVFLDEPTGGLDVEARRALWAEVRSYAAAGGTVLTTTHQLEEAEALATRVILLRRGRIAACGSTADLAAQAGLECAARLEDAFLVLTGEQ